MSSQAQPPPLPPDPGHGDEESEILLGLGADHLVDRHRGEDGCVLVDEDRGLLEALADPLQIAGGVGVHVGPAALGCL